MTNEELDYLIGKYLGWTIQTSDQHDFILLNPKGEVVFAHNRNGLTTPELLALLPNYPKYSTDLNAVHETEKFLISKSIQAWWNYCEDLEHMEDFKKLGNGKAIHATARQRAEALYTTLKECNL